MLRRDDTWLALSRQSSSASATSAKKPKLSSKSSSVSTLSSSSSVKLTTKSSTTLTLSRKNSSKPKLTSKSSTKLTLTSKSSSKPQLTSKTSSKPPLTTKNSTKLTLSKTSSKTALTSKGSLKPQLTSKASSKPQLTSSLSKKKSVSLNQPALSPVVPAAPAMAVTPKDKGVLMFRRAEYLALRNEDDSYFLCQGLQHVYDTTDTFRILWLVPVGTNSNQYTIGYVDETQPECVVTHVKLRRVPGTRRTFILPDAQERIIQRKLKKALDGDDDDDDEEEEEDGPKRPKKLKKVKSIQTQTSKAKAAAKRQPKKQSSVKSKARKPKAVRAPKTPKAKKPPKAVKPKKRKLTDEEKRNPNLLLVKNPAIKVLERDPFLESEENVPFVSVLAHTKLLHRAVRLGNPQMLKKLIDNTNNIGDVTLRYSVCTFECPLETAIRRHDMPCIKLLTKEMFNRPANKPARVDIQTSMLTPEGTGRYNRRSLGISRIRKLTMSRGSREGNNALLKDLDFDRYIDEDKIIFCAMKNGISIDWMKNIFKIIEPSEVTDKMARAYDFIYLAVRWGHRKLAGVLMEECVKYCPYRAPFGFLHIDVLLFDGEELRQFKEASAQKKPYNNNKITPIHCAAINPNPKYLQTVLSVLPEYNITDKENRRPIHYAAACEGTGPLEFLLSKGIECDETDDIGFTPLMVACQVGRPDNVEVLLAHAKKQAEEKAEEAMDTSNNATAAAAPSTTTGAAVPVIAVPPPAVMVNKYGVGGIDRPVVRPHKWNSMCPIHIATEKGHLDIVEILVEYGVDVHKALSPGKDKMVPIHMAARYGQLQILKLLIQNEARVEAKDKLGRTPLIHAVMNGHAHVASYLLHLGANVQVADTSGNSALHYAVAYGWYFCVKLLLQAGADPNAQNDWKMLPLWATYMRGHMGLVDLLLRQPGVDINMKDDQGQTLLMIACGSDIVEGLSDQIKSLVKERGAQCDVVDGSGNNCLHILAGNSANFDITTKVLPMAKVNDDPDEIEVQLKYYATDSYTSEYEFQKDAKRYNMISMNFLTIANMLMEEGCDVNLTNESGHTPLSVAISNNNEPLVSLFAQRMTVFPTSFIGTSKDNILHCMASNCLLGPQKPVLDKLKKLSKNPKKDFEEMVRHVNNHGYNPFLWACRTYQNCNVGSADQVIKVEDLVHVPGTMKPTLKPALNRTQSLTPKNKGKGKQAQPKEEATVKYGEWRQACAREFIKALLDLSAGMVDSQVQQYQYDDEDEVPKEECDRYSNKAHGKNTGVYFMVTCIHEVPEGEELRPGLSLVLSYKPRLLNLYDNMDLPLLQHAIKHSPGEIAEVNVKKLANAGADVDIAFSKERKEDSGVLTCTIYAAMKGMDSLVCSLASLGALVTTEGPNGNTALHHMVQRDRVRHDVLGCVRALLDAGADVNAENEKGQTPLHLAVQVNSGDANITCELESLLLDEGAGAIDRDKFDRLPLHYVFLDKDDSFEKSSKDPIALCSTLTAHLNAAAINSPDVYQRTALHLAANRGAGICAIHLLEKGAALESKDQFGNTPLALATQAQHQSCAIMLLQKSANFNTKAVFVADHKKEKLRRKERGEDVDEDDHIIFKWKPVKGKATPDTTSYPIFQVCVKNEWQGVLFVMLDQLSKVGLPAAATVEAALTTRRYNLAITLLIRFKDFRKLRETNKEGQNLFHILAAKSSPDKAGYNRIAEMLLDRGVSLTQKDKYGCIPLHYACLRKNLDLVNFFLDHSSDNNMASRADNNGMTPVAAAFWNLRYGDHREEHKLTKVCDSLLKNGNADLDGTYAFPSSTAMLFDHVPEAEDFDDVQSQYISLRGDIQVSLLTLAIWRNNLPAAKYLLQHGSFLLNMPDSNNRTPLMHAVRGNTLALIKLLLDPEYDPEVEKAQIEEEKRQAERDKQEKSEQDESASESSEDSSDSDWAPQTSSSRKRVINRRRRYRPVKRRRYGGGGRRVFQLTRPAMIDSDSESSGEESEEEETKQKTPRKETDIDDIDLEFRPFKKVSRIDVNKTDSDGWSAIHHLVAPLDFGTYDNVEILVLLVKNGTLINTENHDRLTPLDLALRYGAQKLAKAMQKLMSVAKKNWKLPTLENSAFVDDGMAWPFALDYKRDAEMMLKQIDAKKGPPKAPDDPIHVPDSSLNFSNGEVVFDDELKIHYDVMLSKIDVGKGHWGLYNFYKMQVVRDINKDLYVLFNRWGRIGDSGQYQRTPYPIKEDAIKEFMKIFRAKTGNKWADVKSFERKDKKYQIVDLDRQPRRRHVNKVEFSLQSKHASRLPEEIQEIMEEITDVSGLRMTMNNMSFDMNNTPLGRIKSETIQKALDLLKEIGVIVKRMDSRSQQQQVDNAADVAADAEQVAKLSNEYYHLIPKGGYAFERLRPLHQMHYLNSERSHLEDLLHVQLAGSMLAGAEFRLKELNPLDYVYRNMGVRIKPLAEDDVQAQFLLKYINGSVSHQGRWGRNNFKILGLYALCRPGEQARLMAANYQNHKLLFHGTKVANMISILTRGLLVENSIGMATAQAYGKGLYLADKFTKSAAYCASFNKDSDVLYMFVCQVGLGRMRTYTCYYNDKKKKKGEYDTTWVYGRCQPDPQYNVMLPTGACMPLGDVKDMGYYKDRYIGNEDSEYIVRNNDQICMRYLIQFKRN